MSDIEKVKKLREATGAGFKDCNLAIKESGGDFAYFMQRAVVGAPGMSDAALAFYTGLFTKTYKSAAWQKYKKKKSLMGDFMAGSELKSYWKVQRDRHKAILKASGAIK
mgnify:CR=1 FL=1